MIAIVISACLVGSPDVCRDHRIPLAQDVDLAHCAMFAPPHFVKWAERYPNWKIVRWHCTNASVEKI